MINGKHTKVTQWIEGRTRPGGIPFVVRIEADAVIPDADPSEPCFEPTMLRALDEAMRLANAGDVEALAKLGEVFIRRTA